MSERRYSPLATLFAATFLFRIGNAVAALALPWFVLSHTKSAAWAGATAASSVIATIIGAWVGGGLVEVRARARRIDLGCGGRRGHGEHPTARCRWRPLEHWADRLRGARCRVRRTRYGRAGQ